MSGRRGLNRQLVVETAAGIVDSEGMAALTLARVAREFDVKPPSLYNHIENLDTLRRDVAMQAFADIGSRVGSAAMGRTGRDGLHSVAAELRAFALAHPGLYELTTHARPDDPEYEEASMLPVEPVLAILRSFDLEGDDAIHAVRALRSALHGFLSLETAGGFGLDVDVDASFVWMIDALTDSLEGVAARR